MRCIFAYNQNHNNENRALLARFEPAADAIQDLIEIELRHGEEDFLEAHSQSQHLLMPYNKFQ